MKKLPIAALLTLALFLTSAMAGVVKIPKKSPGATVDVPSDWEPEETDDGIVIESPDQVATVFLEVTTKKELNDLIDENVDWLTKEQNVKIDADSKKEKDVTIGGREYSRISWDGKSKEFGPAVVGFLFSDLGNGKVITVTYWITKKNAEKHYDQLEKIFGSVKAIK